MWGHRFPARLRYVPEGVAVWFGERLYGEVFRLKTDLTEPYL